ncbi:hypothetical protein PG985_010504 [Apiospora marii]|uniref:ATPase AAA-type core domain-containing protein n=1 Tax=Apiospora marii TaxID=335849 RepID=A0ABR1RZG0_9PEZI
MQDVIDPIPEVDLRTFAPARLREFIAVSPSQESLQRYRNLVSRIGNLLLEYLQRRDAERTRYHSLVIRPAIFGSSEDDARLWMVLCCEDHLRRHMKRFFNQQQVKELCEPQDRPDLAIKVYISKPAVPLARVVAQLPVSVISGFAHNNELCGAPLWIFNPETSATRQVTLGGVIQVTREGEKQYFGLTVGHAAEELTRTSDDPEPVTRSQSESDSSSTESDGSEPTPSFGGEDLRVDSRVSPPQVRERDGPWNSNSMMLTVHQAIADPEAGTYLDWALVDLGHLPNHMEVYNEGGRRVDGQRLLPVFPSSQDIENAQGSAVVVMSPGGPKSGTISLFPSKLLLHPGRAFVDTCIVHLDDPYVFSLGDSGSWVINSETGHVYGHLVAADELGGGHVVPILDTFEDIKTQLDATVVALPGLPGRNPGSEADSASLPPRYAPYPHGNPRRRERQPDLMVCSPPLLYALRSVIRYYSELGLTKDFPTFGWPYPALVHHYDELKDYATECGSRRGSIPCALKRDIPEHVRLLLDYLDTTVMDQVNAEKERNQRGMFTFEFAWVSLKPGTTILYDKNCSFLPRRGVFPFAAPPNGIEWPDLPSRGPFVALSCRSDVPGAHLDIGGWKMEYDGHQLGRILYGARIFPFAGPKEMPWRVLEPASWQEEEDPMEASQGETVGPRQSGNPPFSVTDSVANGRSYWDVIQRIQCWQFKGLSAEYPQVEIDSVVIVDHRQALDEHPQEGVPPLMSDVDLVFWQPHCPCQTCNENPPAPNQPPDRERDFERYCRIDPEPGQTLTRHQCLLCPTSTWAFDLNTHVWRKSLPSYLFKDCIRSAPMDELVMDEARKRLIMRLVEARRDGLVLHLYGGPGLGKTFTAECIAQHTRRPLRTLSSSDVLDASVGHKMSPMEVIRSANRWGTILHFRDGDGLLAERASSSGAPSSRKERFRAAFRDILDTNQGLVILETNRVDDLSEDIISKTHARLHLGPFSESQRRKVWVTICDNYAATRHVYLDAVARNIISVPRVKALKWNGTDMMRVIESAVALAAQDDHDSTEIHVARKELELMLELSGNGGRPSTGTDYRPLRLAMRTAAAIAVASVVVSIFIWNLPINWVHYPQSSQWYPNVMRDRLNGVIGFRMEV